MPWLAFHNNYNLPVSVAVMCQRRIGTDPFSADWN